MYSENKFVKDNLKCMINEVAGIVIFLEQVWKDKEKSFKRCVKTSFVLYSFLDQTFFNKQMSFIQMKITGKFNEAGTVQW